MAADDGNSGTTDTRLALPDRVAPVGVDTIQELDDTVGNYGTTIYSVNSDGDATPAATSLKNYLNAWGKVVTDLKAKATKTPEETAYIKVYDDLVKAATDEVDMVALEKAHDMSQAALEKAHDDSENTRADDPMYRKNIGGNVKIERDAWMVSGKIKFGGPVDFRFSYMDADDLEVSCNGCAGDWSETAADAFNVGLFYTMPAGTELRLTYSEVDNDDNGSYGQGISGTGLGNPGNETEMFAVGIVHWFD